ncbi:MAG: transglutaminase-like cysteine peptidase [Sneathiella sp.]
MPLLLTAFLGLMIGASSVSLAEPAQNEGLFGTVEIPSNNLSALPQWKRVIKDFEKSRQAARLCDQDIQKCTSQQMTLWRAKIQELESSKDSSKVLEINRFINKWRQISDFKNYQKKDYWASPLEFITNGGDSEDFAIMKYISLKELGISPSKMRIVVTNDVLRGKTHTVLSVQSNGKRYVLDSQSNSILQEQFVKYYVPFYSVNETTRWAHVAGQIPLPRAPEGKHKDD